MVSLRLVGGELLNLFLQAIGPECNVSKANFGPEGHPAASSTMAETPDQVRRQTLTARRTAQKMQPQKRRHVRADDGPHLIPGQVFTEEVPDATEHRLDDLGVQCVTVQVVHHFEFAGHVGDRGVLGSAMPHAKRCVQLRILPRFHADRTLSVRNARTRASYRKLPLQWVGGANIVRTCTRYFSRARKKASRHRDARVTHAPTKATNEKNRFDSNQRTSRL